MHEFIEKIGPSITVDEMRLMKPKEDAKKTLGGYCTSCKKCL